jgi:hypothetical protein
MRGVCMHLDSVRCDNCLPRHEPLYPYAPAPSPWSDPTHMDRIRQLEVELAVYKKLVNDIRGERNLETQRADLAEARERDGRASLNHAADALRRLSAALAATEPKP